MPARRSLREGRPIGDVIGHDFADPALLEQALTHASAATKGCGTYERLEFLGDRVLALLVAEMLFSRFPGATEGELAPRLNALVRKETCAEIARRTGFAPHIKLGGGEAASGGRRKTGILADACEAIIGALYLDGGVDAARVFVVRHWAPLMAEMTAAPQDAKTVLQEWTQSHGVGTPDYELVERTGPDHAPSFRVKVSIRSGAEAVGEGTSKRAAEQAAAESLLITEKVWQTP